MLMLGIESSCDETAVAVVEGDRDVRSSVVATQHDLHVPYAGVVPEIASRRHLECITPVLDEALRIAGVTFDDLDAIAVGHAPGLIGSLLIGVSAAKALAWSLERPLIGVHHVLAHLHAPALDQAPIAYPAIGLVASGGHTALTLQEDAMHATVIGQTIDDAVGEAFDKAGTLLGAGYPGGPAIERLAKLGRADAFRFPIARLRNAPLDFSFAGLKTALLYAARGTPVGRGREARFPRDVASLSDEMRADLAASFQWTAVQSLIRHVDTALEHHEAQSLIGGGGVLCNTPLREELEQLAQRHQVELRLAAPQYCIDNAAMIAGLGHIAYQQGQRSDLQLQAQARMHLGSLQN